MSVDNTVINEKAPPSSRAPVVPRRRSLAKMVSWRVTATTTTFVIASLITGDVRAGLAIGGVEAGAKMALYYAHERAWERVPINA